MLEQYNELNRKRKSCIQKAAETNNQNRSMAYVIMASRYARQMQQLIISQ